MEFTFQGKRALVTGAGKGIGRTTAVRLADLGANVIAISRTQADLDSLKAEVVARGMVARGPGVAIVNVSSIGAKRPSPKHTIYCSSKAALDMLSATMAVDLGPHVIRVNSVNPSIVLTAMGKEVIKDTEKKKAYLAKTPLGRLTEESDVADAIVYLLSDKSAMVSGHALLVDGGKLNVA